jgi:crossover junction endodeoxyribonuclease RuvC
MIILGIDPGTATTGYGILNLDGKSFSVLEYGLIETSKNNNSQKRLSDIYGKLSILIKNFKPDAISMEKIFFATNAKTAIAVGQAQGVMMLCAHKHNTELFEYAPGTIKKQISGSGRSDKKMMQKSVRKILGSKIKSKKHQKTHFDNSADALAIALCHAVIIGKITLYNI